MAGPLTLVTVASVRVRLESLPPVTGQRPVGRAAR